MKRSEFREKVVLLLYVTAMDGDFDKTEYKEDLLRQYTDVIDNLQRIDDVISENLVGYTIDRLNYVDLSIIRYAVYEMLFSETPSEIIINEAVNLTKKYSNLDDDAAKRFNNRLLDNIKTRLNR